MILNITGDFADMKAFEKHKQIIKQQSIAKELLGELHKVAPEIIYIAGGAPRDWNIGELAKDIDIFVSCKHYHQINAWLENNLVNNDNDFIDESGQVASGIEPSELSAVLQFKYKGLSFDIVVMDRPEELDLFEDVFRSFDIGLCKIACRLSLVGNFSYVGSTEYSADRLYRQLTLDVSQMSPIKREKSITRLAALQKRLLGYTANIIDNQKPTTYNGEQWVVVDDEASIKVVSNHYEQSFTPIEKKRRPI